MTTTEDRFWAKVDKCGPTHPLFGTRCWLWTGAKDPNGYGKFWDGEKRIYAHRHAYGPKAEGHLIDHRCHNKSCVNPAHLRLATPKQNMENRSSINVNSKSGVRGVTWYAPTCKWRASIGHHGRAYNLGYYETLSEAEAVVVAKRNELFTHNDLDRASL